MPAAKKRFPDTIHQQQVCPEEQFRVVPCPRRKTNQPTGNKGYCCRKEQPAKRDFSMGNIAALRDAKVNKKKERERENEAEIIESEPPGRLAGWIHPVGLPGERTCLSEAGNT